MADDDNVTERRHGQVLVEYRMKKMEEEQEKTNVSLVNLDNKLDGLRADLFEKAIFVSITQMQLELQQRDFRIQSLEATRTTNISERMIKIGFGVAILAAVVSPVVSIWIGH